MSKKYNILYLDPPWSYKDKALAGNRGAGCKYPVQSIEWMKALPIQNIAADDCVMFMWVTMPKLNECFELIEAYGFTYKTCAFTWVKRNKKSLTWFWGMGRWSRCMAGDTGIWLYNKKTNIVYQSTLKDLDNIDDHLIWTRNGWKKILDKWKTEKKSFHTFKTKLGDINVSDDHRLLFKRPKSSRGKYWDSIEYGDINDYERWLKLSATVKQGYKTNLLFSKKVIESPNPHMKEKEFDLNYDMGWLLGLFIAEGNYGINSSRNQIRYSLHSKEMAYFEKIKQIIHDLDMNGDRYFNSKIQARNFVRENKMSVYFSSKKIKSFFECFSYGVGSHGKRLNLEKILQTSFDFRLGIFDGIMQGDGHYLNKSQWKIVLCNQNLINDISQLCFSLGIQNKTDTQKPSYKNKTLCFKYSLICLNRKEIYFEQNNLQAVTIEDFIKNSGEDELYDITVDGGDFIANNIVSHNSNPELCLIATKGKPKRVSASVHSIIESPIRAHSQKPDETRDRIVQLCGDIPRVELFARESAQGWDAIGNGIDGRDIMEVLSNWNA